MALPLLATKPITQNARVHNFSVGGDEAPRLQVDVDEQIEQAYRQIFFHAFKVDREPMLEMQLRNGDITVRDFVRGLLLSRKFREGFYRCNSNYRVVEQVVGRVLGREVNGDQERIAWSIVIANQGLEGFVDTLINSAEYIENFGLYTVPFQRSRVLAGHVSGHSGKELAELFGACCDRRTAQRIIARGGIDKRRGRQPVGPLSSAAARWADAPAIRHPP